jgi:serine/threonine protein phosphatase PrpC
MTTVLAAASATDKGLVRETNQDAVLTDGMLYAVADGFGHKGDHASRRAVEALLAGFAAAPDRDGLVVAAHHANEQIWSPEDADGPTTGTTLIALAVLPAELGGPVAVAIGDSRLYRIRERVMEQVTDDHSVAGELIRAGQLTSDEARSHPQRHLLTRALGIGPTIYPDVIDVECRPGDRLLICSDGLYTELDDGVILSAATTEDPTHAAQQLVDEANGRGGADNISVIVIDVG